MEKCKQVFHEIFLSTAPVKHYPKKECNTNAKERGWTQKKIIIGWIFVYLYSSSKTIAQHLYPSLAPFATSHFSGLALLSSQSVVESAVFVVARPAAAKVADHLGRLEGWCIVILAHALGSILYAAAPNIGCYFAGTVFWEIGIVSGHLMMELYASDTSTTDTRVLWSSFIQTPSIWAPWISAPVLAGFLKVTTWRWGYGAFAIILPVCSIGTVVMMSYMRIKYERKAGALGDFYSPGGPMRFFKSFDVVGLVTLCAGLILFFLPITLAAGSERWKLHSYIAMLTIGSFLIVFFPLWEYFVPKNPFLPWRLFKSRVMCCSAGLVFLMSLANKLYTPYFITWLMVVKGQSPKAATNVSSVLVVSSNVFGMFFAAPYMWWSGRPKRVLVFGCCFHLIGIGLTYHYRQPSSGLAIMIVAQCFEGVGRGCIYIPAATMAQAMFDKHKVAAVTALYFTSGGIGQVIGDAICGAIYRELYPRYIHKYAPDIPHKDLDLIINKIKKATKFPMGSLVRTEINHAFNETMRHMLVGPLGCVGAMVLVSLMYPSIDLKSANRDEEVEGEDHMDSDDPMAVHGVPEGTGSESENDLEQQYGEKDTREDTGSESENTNEKVSAERAAAGYINDNVMV